MYHFYPRSPCGERRGAKTIAAEVGNFYPRSPCGERLILTALLILPTKFLSTLSLRRATQAKTFKVSALRISIHALLAESDGKPNKLAEQKLVFLSTLSLRRATVRYDNYNLHCTISIHALLAESDAPEGADTGHKMNFYPRSPCGERLTSTITICTVSRFLSTLSLRRATFTSVVSSAGTTDFYPRSPCGERRQQPDGTTNTTYFYPRSPCGERPSIGTLRTVSVNFYPRSPCGERRCSYTAHNRRNRFLSTLSLRRAT